MNVLTGSAFKIAARSFKEKLKKISISRVFKHLKCHLMEDMCVNTVAIKI